MTKLEVPVPPLFERLYAPIAAEMQETERRFREQLRHRHPFVDELASYGCMLGGKRLRPALLLLAGKACGEIRSEHYLLGTVVEMIHTATLVHDDVLDEADMRRHFATVNARWDNEAAVLLGDYLFTQAFFLASTTGSTTACRLIGEATNRVCAGEIMQKGSRGNLALTEREYFAIIEGKTAALTECSCRLGAIFSGVEESLAQHVAEYGRLLGLAFQITDDLLDYVGEADVVGKTLGTDLEKQKPTLPIIHAHSCASREERLLLSEIFYQPSHERLTKLLHLLDRYESLQYARNRAIEFVEQARLELKPLPPSPAKETLLQMADFVVRRSH